MQSSQQIVPRSARDGSARDGVHWKLLTLTESDAAVLDEVAQVIRSQLQNRNKIWLKMVKRRGLAKSAREFLADIHRHEHGSGRVRDTTWARSHRHTRRDALRAQNVMGYHYRAVDAGSSHSTPIVLSSDD